MEQHRKAESRAKEVSRIIENLLTQYASNGYFGVVTFTLSMQAGLINSGRHGTERQLPITRDS